jgi:predicted N-acetyltransferase YhbS
MITYRELQRDEIELIWIIDRREVIDQIYYYENGALVLRPEHYDMGGWPPGEAEKYTPLLYESFERGAWFYGAFEAGKLVGLAILENRFIGKKEDTLQLKFLHVSRAYRGQGLGVELFRLAEAKARQWGARRMYVSATPSQHTVDFYLRRGCLLSNEPDPELWALEPEDIHLEYEL